MLGPDDLKGFFFQLKWFYGSSDSWCTKQCAVIWFSVLAHDAIQKSCWESLLCYLFHFAGTTILAPSCWQNTVLCSVMYNDSPNGSGLKWNHFLRLITSSKHHNGNHKWSLSSLGSIALHQSKSHNWPSNVSVAEASIMFNGNNAANAYSYLSHCNTNTSRSPSSSPNDLLKCQHRLLHEKFIRVANTTVVSKVAHPNWCLCNASEQLHCKHMKQILNSPLHPVLGF